MLIDSRDRAKPASSITKPDLHPEDEKTRRPASHAVLIALISGLGPLAGRLRKQGRRQEDLHRGQDQDEPDHLPAHEGQGRVRAMAGSLMLVTNRSYSLLNGMAIPHCRRVYAGLNAFQ